MTIDQFVFGFSMGTFKFLFSQWLAFGYCVQQDVPVTFFNVLIPTVAGAWVSSAFFYFSSGFFMKRASARRLKAMQRALAEGKPVPNKRKFTRVNKFVVKIKMNVGIYAVTFIAPLILSIPCVCLHGMSL